MLPVAIVLIIPKTPQTFFDFEIIFLFGACRGTLLQARARAMTPLCGNEKPKAKCARESLQEQKLSPPRSDRASNKCM